MPPYIRNTLLNFFSFFLIAFSLYIFISLVSYDASDSGFFNKNSNDVINNLGGPLGALISDLMFTLIGFGSYLVLLIGSVWAIQSLFIDDKYNSALKVLVRLASSFFIILSFCAVGAFYVSENFGGVIGLNVLTFLSSLIGYIGTLIFLIVLTIPAMSFSFNFSWLKTIDVLGNLIVNISKISLNLIKNIFAFLLKFFNSIRSLLSEINQSLKSRSIKENVKKSSKPKISSEPQTPKEKIINDVSAVSKQPDLPIKDETQLKEVPKLNT